MKQAELVEIREFLAEVPPFSVLDDEGAEALLGEMVIRYLRRGAAFPPQDEERAQFYVVRKGAIEQRDEHDALLAKFAEGDCCDAAMLAVGQSRVVEDALLYCLPVGRIHELRRRDAEFDGYFQRSLGERLRHARRAVGEHLSFRADMMSMPLSAFLTLPPITAEPSCSIREVAQRMGRRATSAMLVIDGGKLRGIVTDRDLRSRCLATGLSPEQPIASIMTSDPITLAPDHPAFEALMLMTRHGIDHLPVLQDGVLRGLVSNRELLRSQGANAAHLAMLVRSCESPGELPALSAELPELQMQMLAGGATAGQIGQAVSSIADALAGRLIELAQRSLGPPPVAFAWMAGGSQGRQEQSTHSDQDNALILGDGFDAEAHGAYFEALARAVTDGLDACGFRYCPGDIMASNPKWRQSIGDWLDLFRGWVRHTDENAAKVMTNFLDLRVVAGDPSLHARLTEGVLAECGQGERFVAQLVENSLVNRPPLGFFRNFVLIDSGEHAHTFDIKRKGIIPIVDLARIQSIAAGIGEVNTIRRLHACAARKLLSADAASELEEAHEFLGLLRVRHQGEQIRAGLAPDNYIDPDRLTALERRHLKDVFRAVAALQDTLALRYATPVGAA